MSVSDEEQYPVVGFLLFPRMTALDLVGPFEVLSRLPVRTALVAASPEPVRAERGVTFVPDVTFDDCPELTIFVIPGGVGEEEVSADPAAVAFVRDRAERADVVLSICTGTLILAATGLLAGRRAATHWLAVEELRRRGAVVVTDRVCQDGKFWSGAGVSAGIDAALALISSLGGAALAQEIQLAIEYDPAPPHDVGSPDKAPADLVTRLREQSRFPQLELVDGRPA